MMQFRFRWTVLTTMLLALLGMGSVLAFGQATNTGTVTGTITDQSGAVVPGALITLTETTTNTSRAGSTSNGGTYVIQDVPPGTYSIIASKAGFETDKIDAQTVSVGTQTTANFKLQVGSAQTTVEVQASSADLQTLNSTVGSTLEPEAIDALPSLLHDVGTFTELQPGVSPDGSVAGTVNDQSTFSLDGGNNSSDMDGSMAVYTNSFSGDPTGVARNISGGPTGVLPTPADSVEEFKVNTANQTADFNNSSGAQVEIVTKRGTNQYHGTVYEYYLDNTFGGNSWDNNLSGTPIPSYHYNKYGASAGGPIAPKLAGGKTYLFGMYQGWRFPQATTYSRSVPSANLINGIVTLPDANGNPALYDLKALDPRGIGINPAVQAMWQKYEPAQGSANVSTCSNLAGSYCDSKPGQGGNEYEFKANVGIPSNDDFMVARLDHDFGDKWHFNTSYRYYRLTRVTSSQVDIGGFFTGDTLGAPVATSSKPSQPWYYVAGLTTNITPTITNDFHYSYLRNYWSWSDNNAPSQSGASTGAIEPFGETATGVLSPFNLDNQDIRTRFWDGHDHFLRDDVTLLKGNHIFSFGGQYQHNFNFHQRTDNGGGINYTLTYQLGDSAGAGVVDMSGLTANGYPNTGSNAKIANRVAAAALGIVTDAQVAYTRAGNSLTLNPPLTPAQDKSTIPFYNVYFSDSWHMKPSFTLTYGMGWTLEMPPTEATGKQVDIVDASGTQISMTDYLDTTKRMAQAGQVYNPELGFSLVGNVGSGQKYPFKPFYGSFSPRIGAAWNPHFADDTFMGKVFGAEKTVIRGGYGRIYGRLNGVDLVLVPLLGIGLIQPVQCTKALASGQCGPANPTVAAGPNTAFRIGIDGNSAPLAAAAPTLPQPIFPGYNSAAGSASEALDPNFRPNDVDSFDFTIQRQISAKTKVEVGYIGRLIHHEYQPVDLNAVPYMITSGTQNFAQAYLALEKQLGCTTSAAACGAAGIPGTVAPQSFFENALKGTGYCTGFANCTTAVMNNEFSNLTSQSVWSMYSDLDNGGFNFPRSMMNTPIPASQSPVYGSGGQASSGMALNGSIGHGNYHGGFVSFTMSNWHGLTMHHNFTYSKALGTGAEVQATSEYTPNDPFNLDAMYGVQPFNRKFVYNTYMVWTDPFYKGQNGLMGRVLGGWTASPIFTAGNGAPVYCNTVSGGQAFGGADANDYFDNEQCVFTSKYNGGAHSHYGVAGAPDPVNLSLGTVGQSNGTTVGSEVNTFKDPVAVFNQVRAPMLGLDTKNPGVGPIIGMPYWNVDASLSKNFKIWERTSIQASIIMTNVFNHNVMGDPSLSLSSPGTWGNQTAQANLPRTMEFGFRASF
jgi:hypothetical protein